MTGVGTARAARAGRVGAGAGASTATGTGASGGISTAFGAGEGTSCKGSSGLEASAATLAADFFVGFLATGVFFAGVLATLGSTVFAAADLDLGVVAGTVAVAFGAAAALRFAGFFTGADSA
jgi:hypothetical protein